MKINEIRSRIDEIDKEILTLLSKRKDLASEIAKLKENLDIPVFDKKREEKILNKISQKAKQFGLDADSVSKIFQAIFHSSRTGQQRQIGNVNCDIRNIGIIGFGRFGKLIVNHLSHDFDFYVFDKLDKRKEIKDNDAVPASLNDVCKQDIVILAVPISEIENTLKKIKNLLKKKSIVIDVCSVKEYPAKLMRAALPKYAQILATHPMFGPDTASDSLEGKKIALCRVRIQNELYSKIERFLESKQMNVIETTPEQHDREIAKSLVLAQFIGRALMDMKAAAQKIDTKGYKELMKILDIAKNDTWQLFEDMCKYNKYSAEVRKNLIKSLNKIEKRLKK